MNKKIFFIFFFAFVIRLIAINQSLWLDEAITAKVVMNYGYTEIISKFSLTDFHPPLYYLFMKLWTNLFGYSEIALRMPSVLFSLLVGWIIYRICRLHKSFGEPLWATTFFLFNPLIVYYSQEARMYMMSTFLLTTALYYFLPMSSSNLIGGSRNMDSRLRGNDKHILFFGLFISLAFLTFYGSIFLIATMFLYLLHKKQYKAFFVSCLLFLVSFVLVSPLLYQQLMNSKVALSNVANWSLVLGKANIKNLLLIPIKFSIGRISFEPKWLYWAIAGIWTGFVLFTIRSVLIRTDLIKRVLFLLIFPLVLGFLVSFFVPMLQYFRFLYLIPIVCLLLGFRLSGQAKFNRGGWMLVGGFIIFSLIYLLLPQFHREDWKSLVKSLPKDIPVYMIKASSDPVKYYNENLTINELTLLRPMGYGGQRKLEKEIIVIPYTADIYGLDYKSLLNKSSYQLKKEVSFREVTYEQWVVFYTPQMK